MIASAASADRTWSHSFSRDLIEASPTLGPSRPRPGIDDYITAIQCVLLVTMNWASRHHQTPANLNHKTTNELTRRQCRRWRPSGRQEALYASWRSRCDRRASRRLALCVRWLPDATCHCSLITTASKHNISSQPTCYILPAEVHLIQGQHYGW